MKVRRFRGGDLAAVARMNAALFPESPPGESERDVRRAATRDDGALFVTEREDGTPAGFVEVGTRPYVDGCDTSPVGFIEAWFVDEDVRRSGYGRALLNAAEDWAREHGYSEMGSDALLDNVDSHRAHRASGYEEVERAVRFRKSL